MLRITLLVTGFFAASGAWAAPLPEPISYAKPCPGGEFVLVVFGSKEAEARLKAGDNKKHAEGVRAKYPVPGMYRAGDGAELVYPLDGEFRAFLAIGVASEFSPRRYVPDENVYLTADGRTVIRIEGSWWKTKAYTGGTRLAPEVEQNQFESPAVSIYRDGILLKRHPLKSLIDDPLLLPHTPEHVLWVGGSVLREDAGQFVLFTQDTNKITFDYRTGEIAGTEKTGYGSRFGQKLILVTLGLTLLLLIAWALYAFRSLRGRRAGGLAAHSASPIPGRPLI